MNSQDNPDQDLQRREQELKAREEALRLRELESEINQPPPPLYQTEKQPPPKASKKRWVGKLLKAGQFLGIVVAVIIAIKVAAQLAYVVMIGAIAWIVYKIAVDKERS
ncbi:MAG: hypothetical protein F6J92_22905 [Symploca sp. SIO1A3]|nr:hypothetical protein [Symploca sp. SIO1A3]